MIDCIFIPLTAIFVSAAFGAVSVAWDSARRATRSMGALFLASGWWATVDLLTFLESDPDRALFWIRWVHIGPLMLGPAVLWICSQMLPQVQRRLERHARWGAVVCLTLSIALAFLPGVTVEMIPTDYGGWMPRYGLLAMCVIPLGAVLPLYACFEASRAESLDAHTYVDRRRVWGIRVAVSLSLFIAMPTELLFPLLEIPLPRLGALGVSCASALVWISVLHDVEDLRVTPQGVARALLAKLHDGVALVQLDGTILSSNQRLTELTGRTSASLVGASLASLIDARIETIREGLEDRASSLRSLDGEMMPVSLSSSIARSQSGKPIGVVVVFRDLREIDALRRQLLTSGRLAAVGELAAGIAHEVNNPVAFIRSDLNLLAERMREVQNAVRRSGAYEDGVVLLERCGDRVAAALDGIEQITEVVVDVREFAHVGGAGQGGSDPEAVVEGAMRLARLQRGEDVALRIANVVGGDRIECGQEVKQILLALLRILADRAEKGGAVEAHLRTTDESLLIGLTVSPLAHPFASLLACFESLSPNALEGDGASLGFVIASELVEQLGGSLRAESLGANRARVELCVPRLAAGALG